MRSKVQLYILGHQKFGLRAHLNEQKHLLENIDGVYLPKEFQIIAGTLDVCIARRFRLLLFLLDGGYSLGREVYRCNWKEIIAGKLQYFIKMLTVIIHNRSKHNKFYPSSTIASLKWSILDEGKTKSVWLV